MRLTNIGALIAIKAILTWQTATATTRTVTNLNDGGAGSLRDTIAASVNGDAINFSVTGAITLTNELAIGRTLTIIGPGANGLAVSGNNASRVFNISSGITVNISNLTISNGHVTAPASSTAQGGGILNQGMLNLSNCILNNNSASGGAGGAARGGGVANQGTLTLTNTTLSNNSANGGDGGTGSSGGAGSGGGIYNGSIFNPTTQTLVNCTFSGNSANGGAGSDRSGGSGSGGGIYNSIFTPASQTLVNCTFSGNSANGGGGGSDRSGGAGNGGALYEAGITSVRNAIIAGNSATGGSGGSSGGGNGASLGPDVAGTIGSQGHNLIGKIDGSSGWGGSDLTGTVALPLNALLGPLQDNGGTTFTMALQPTSAAIDAGDDSVTNSLATDQRGRPRKLGAHVDIGAFEVIPNSPLLSITRSLNKVVLSWSTNDVGFRIESTLSLLNESNTWTTAGTPTIVGSQYTVTNNTTSGSKLYRLRSP